MKKILVSRKLFNMLLLITLIRIYGAFIETTLPDGTLLVHKMKTELYSAGFSPLLLIILLPFVSGITLGIAVGFTGASLPIAVSMLGPHPALNILLATTLLAYASGYMGMILSPVHICLIVTNEYFKTSLFQSMKGLLLPCACMLITAFFFYWIISLLV